MTITAIVPTQVTASTPPAAETSLVQAKDLRIGTILMNRGLLTAAQINEILHQQASSDLRFGEIAVNLRMVQPKDIDDALALQFGLSQVEPRVAGLPEQLIVSSNPSGPFAEALRGLRSQLMQRWFDGSPAQTSVAITSVDRGDGKSFITANLAAVFAQLGERTLVIDADLRHPTQHKIFNIKNRMGLSGVLSGRAGLEEIVDIPHVPNLSLLPSGPLPPNPQELLGGQRFGELLNLMSSRYNTILVDTPSAQQATDINVVAQLTGAVILVGRKDKTKSTELTQLANILSSGGVKILGATFNTN